MINFRVLWLSASVLLGALCTQGLALGEPRTLYLLGHSVIETPAVRLHETQWSWLRERRRLLMGISGPDYAPFELSTSDELEGITADYASLIADALNITIEVRRYDNRDEVIRQLAARGVPGRLGGCPNIGVEKAFQGQPACPQADLIGKRVLGLPCYPTYTDEEIDEICRHVREVCGSKN